MDTATITTITRYVWAPDYITAAELLARGYSYFTRELAEDDNLDCRKDGYTLYLFTIDEVSA